VTESDLSSPLSFSEFCKKYNDDREFRFYFDQLHMFIHLMGRKDEPWERTYQTALGNMIVALEDIERFIAFQRENLLRNFQPRERTRTASTEASKQVEYP
jgi:hypothetical protein